MEQQLAQGRGTQRSGERPNEVISYESFISAILSFGSLCHCASISELAGSTKASQTPSPPSLSGPGPLKVTIFLRTPLT